MRVITNCASQEELFMFFFKMLPRKMFGKNYNVRRIILQKLYFKLFNIFSFNVYGEGKGHLKQPEKSFY